MQPGAQAAGGRLLGQLVGVPVQIAHRESVRGAPGVIRSEQRVVGRHRLHVRRQRGDAGERVRVHVTPRRRDGGVIVVAQAAPHHWNGLRQQRVHPKLFGDIIRAQPVLQRHVEHVLARHPRGMPRVARTRQHAGDASALAKHVHSRVLPQLRHPLLAARSGVAVTHRPGGEAALAVEERSRARFVLSGHGRRLRRRQRLDAAVGKQHVAVSSKSERQVEQRVQARRRGAQPCALLQAVVPVAGRLRVRPHPQGRGVAAHRRQLGQPAGPHSVEED